MPSASYCTYYKAGLVCARFTGVYLIWIDSFCSSVMSDKGVYLSRGPAQVATALRVRMPLCSPAQMSNKEQ